MALLGTTLFVARRPGTRGDPTYVALALSVVGLLIAVGLEAFASPPPGIRAETYLGWALLVLGGGLTIWAHVLLADNYSPTAAHPSPDHHLVTSGPYRALNHPQYVGNVLSCAGLLAALGSRWAWLALLPVVAAVAWRVRAEERWLRTRYPDRGRAPVRNARSPGPESPETEGQGLPPRDTAAD